MVLAFMYAQANPLMSEADYPYTSGTGQVAPCTYDSTKGVGKVVDYEEVEPNDVDAMKAAL